MQLEIAGISEPELWEAIHAASGIPSHALSLAKALAIAGVHPRIARVSTREGGMVLPFFERQWRGTTDICTWLSVSGAQLWGDPIAALTHWNEYARACGWVAGYIQVEPESQLPKIISTTAGNTVFMLELGLPDPLSSASQIVRRKLRRSDTSGVSLIMDRNVLARALVALYPAAMARLGASKAYDLPPPSLEALVFAPETMVFGAASVDGTIEAVMIFPFTGERAEFFVGASTPEGRDLTTWLLGRALLELRARGIRRLNLGGGVRHGDGLFEFKRRFGGAAMSLGAIRQIYNPGTYAALCAVVGADPASSWFPAYRVACGSRSSDPAIHACQFSQIPMN